MKQVRETNAGSAISAYIILNKKGDHVATLQSHSSGTVSIDVWTHDCLTELACLKTALKTGRLSEKALINKMAEAPDYYSSASEREEWAAHELYGLQQGKAGGYGYDKFAAALSGLIIDGHTMANHCGSVPECEKTRASLLKRYWADMHASPEHVKSEHYKTALAKQKEWDEKARKIGASFANWRTETNSYGSLHFQTGLERLEMLGYRIIQAI